VAEYEIFIADLSKNVRKNESRWSSERDENDGKVSVIYNC